MVEIWGRLARKSAMKFGLRWDETLDYAKVGLIYCVSYWSFHEKTISHDGSPEILSAPTKAVSSMANEMRALRKKLRQALQLQVCACGCSSVLIYSFNSMLKGPSFS